MVSLYHASFSGTLIIGSLPKFSRKAMSFILRVTTHHLFISPILCFQLLLTILLCLVTNTQSLFSLVPTRIIHVIAPKKPYRRLNTMLIDPATYCAIDTQKSGSGPWQHSMVGMPGSVFPLLQLCSFQSTLNPPRI